MRFQARSTFWVFSILNSVLLALVFFGLWNLHPEWFRYPWAWQGDTLGATLLILVFTSVAGTWIAWNGLTGPGADGPVTTKGFLAHAAGSGAVAGFLFFVLALLVFFVPVYGIRSFGALLSLPPALALGALVGLVVGGVDAAVGRLMGVVEGEEVDAVQ